MAGYDSGQVTGPELSLGALGIKDGGRFGRIKMAGEFLLWHNRTGSMSVAPGFRLDAQPSTVG